MFDAILIAGTGPGQTAARVSLDEQQLPPGDVTLRILYSTLNYKDALALTGQSPIIRQFPMVPGIDLVGIVEASSHPHHHPGDTVVLNGWGIGERHWGGLAQKAHVNGDWLIPLPAGLTPRQSMAIGTAGFTAMLSILALERHGLVPDDGEVLVTGASGGVGSVAVLLLSRLGYRVVASTGRPQHADFLRQLGAAAVIDRQTLSSPGTPLQEERWAAAIDAVGSHTLANVCASLRANGAVAACGLAQGMDFPATVAPFILRGVSLLGINSVTRPTPERMEAWQRLSRDLDLDRLDTLTQEIGLDDVIPIASQLLAGQIQGRLVVRLPA